MATPPAHQLSHIASKTIERFRLLDSVRGSPLCLPRFLDALSGFRSFLFDNNSDPAIPQIVDEIFNCVAIFIQDSEALRQTLSDLVLAQQTTQFSPPLDPVIRIFLSVAGRADTERDLPAMANAFFSKIFQSPALVPLLNSDLPAQLFARIGQGLGGRATTWALTALFLDTDQTLLTGVNHSTIFSAFRSFLKQYRDGGPSTTIAIQIIAEFACRLAKPLKGVLYAFAEADGFEFVTVYLVGDNWERTFLALLTAAIVASESVVFRFLRHLCAQGPTKQPAVFNLLIKFRRYQEINAIFPI
jgi:hypothetical protein